MASTTKDGSWSSVSSPHFLASTTRRSIGGSRVERRVSTTATISKNRGSTRLLEEYGDASSVWNPAEWETQLDLELDPRLSAGCASASQDIWQNDLQEEANLFMVHLAQELDARALPLTRTDDFEVRAVDLERT